MSDKKMKRKAVDIPGIDASNDLARAIRERAFGGISIGEDISSALVKFSRMSGLRMEWNYGYDEHIFVQMGGVEYSFSLNSYKILICTQISIKPIKKNPHYLYDNEFFYIYNQGIKIDQKHSKSMRIFRDMGLNPKLHRDYGPQSTFSYLLNEHVTTEFAFNFGDEDDAPKDIARFLGIWIHIEAVHPAA